MYREHCYIASDYTSEIRAFANAKTLAAADRIVQFPFVPLVRFLLSLSSSLLQFQLAY